MSAYSETIQAQATQDVCAALLKAGGSAMQAHGEDPQGIAVLAAGYVMSIRAIEKNISPVFGIIVREMLRPK